MGQKAIKKRKETAKAQKKTSEKPNPPDDSLVATPVTDASATVTQDSVKQEKEKLEGKSGEIQKGRKGAQLVLMPNSTMLTPVLLSQQTSLLRNQSPHPHPVTRINLWESARLFAKHQRLSALCCKESP
jgi:hypothetical protein